VTPARLTGFVHFPRPPPIDSPARSRPAGDLRAARYIHRPVRYPSDDLTPAERERLAPHVTNLDGPVFALVNLPETVKGALFARYSRYPGTLRRLFLEEFADSLPAVPAGYDQGEGRRAAELYERIFVGYGDDSVAQLGGAHVACEWVSNILTKILQRPRLAAYLEQSTRYIAYDAPLPGGGYRYYREAALGPEYAAAMDTLFATYEAALPRVRAWVDETFPRAEGEPQAARRRAVNAKALDLLRGLLPAASLSHMGIYATGQAYEQLILHLLGHPLPEARRYGTLILDAIKAVMPSFVARVERPERGGDWVAYLERRRAAGERWAARLGLDRASRADDGPSVRLLDVDGDEERLLAALLFEAAGTGEAAIRAAVARLDGEARARLLGELVGERANRRHRPGRGFEALRYRFEIVSDYGAFRDLQRHRMLTVQWQAPTPDLGADVPEEVAAAGVGDAYERALERSRAEYARLVDAGLAAAAPYALCLGYRIRYVLDLNAREAMHLIELRSGREGHPTYRAVAHEMHAQIAAVHPAVAAAMTHVDSETEPRLERILSEMRQHARREAASGRR
jgi:thymidylate synthase ThyX